jgi:hypothetical protein
VLSEESGGHEGYSNLDAIRTTDKDIEIDFRLREFSPTQLVRWPPEAAAELGLVASVQPIRGRSCSASR